MKASLFLFTSLSLAGFAVHPHSGECGYGDKNCCRSPTKRADGPTSAQDAWKISVLGGTSHASLFEKERA